MTKFQAQMPPKSATPRQQKRTFAQVFWTVFPHACFICTLVIYALLGALMFSHVEGNNNRNQSEEYRTFLWNLSDLAKSFSENEISYETFEKNVRKLIREVKLEWFPDSTDKWSFLGSLFFCCTVFTTVGYGHTYPVTRLGKYLCMLYALFGIPLMFLVLTDMGDILAAILSASYNKIRQLPSKLVPRQCLASFCKTNKESKPATLSLKQSKIVLHEPLNIAQVLRSQSSLKSKPGQYRNTEIFEKIIAWENQFLAPPKPMERCSSCPQLDTGKTMDEIIDNIDNIGKEVEKLDVPFLLMTLIVFAYISCAAAILPHWERHLNFEEAFYFCFITLTTIGFGDIALEHPNFFLFFSLYIVIGIEIVIIAFKLGQDRLISLYKKMIFYFGWKKVAYKVV